MTVEELDALPEFHPYTVACYQVGKDGKVTLPNGRTITATPGSYINIPTINGERGVFWVGEKTPLCWRDADGVYWRPTRLLSGEWFKERA